MTTLVVKTLMKITLPGTFLGSWGIPWPKKPCMTSMRLKKESWECLLSVGSPIMATVKKAREHSKMLIQIAIQEPNDNGAV